MPGTVLVAYATKYGSTQEVAEAVAATLRDAGLGVDLQPAKKVQSLEEYGAVVLGAPLYIFRWHKDAHRFLGRHRKALTQKPVAIFALGPTDNNEEGWKSMRAKLADEVAKHTWLSPAAVELFGGKYDPAKLRFPDSLMATMKASPLYGLPASDVRDWDAIRAWASGLRMKLGL